MISCTSDIEKPGNTDTSPETENPEEIVGSSIPNKHYAILKGLISYT